MPITAFYTALLAPLFLYLSVRVIGRRREAKVALGPGDDSILLRRMRVHANFAEYVPFTLLSMGLAEGVGVASLVIHIIGVVLVAGRYIHAYGVSQQPENFKLRVTGMTATFTAIALSAIMILVKVLPVVFAL
ncbi:MAG: MAPEG family protein [Hyphomicrobiaceae bacterium]